MSKGGSTCCLLVKAPPKIIHSKGLPEMRRSLHALHSRIEIAGDCWQYEQL